MSGESPNHIKAVINFAEIGSNLLRIGQTSLSAHTLRHKYCEVKGGEMN